jgi:hypothetical protein
VKLPVIAEVHITTRALSGMLYLDAKFEVFNGDEN